MPKGFRTEVGSKPELAELFNVVEHNSRDYPPRTRRNVADSDATIVVGNTASRGSQLTIRYCDEQDKPYCTISFTSAFPSFSVQTAGVKARELAAWLTLHDIHVLNVAGNRESGNPGIQAFTRKLVAATLTLVQAKET